MDYYNIDNNKTTFKELVRFIALSFSFGIQNVVWSCIPILFYRPTTVCTFQGKFKLSQYEFYMTKFKCSEYNACHQQLFNDKIVFSRVSQYDHINSVSMEFDLYCDKKIYEANILSIGILGQAVGAFVALILNTPSYLQQKTIITLLIIQCLIFAWCNTVDSVSMFTLIFFTWNFISNFFQCIIYSHVNSSFTGKLKKFGPTVLNILWAGTTVIYIMVTMVLGDWRDNLGKFLFLFTLACLVLLVITYNKKFDALAKLDYDTNLQQESSITDFNHEINETMIDEDEFFGSFKQALNKIKGNKLWQLNCLIFILNMIAGTVSYYLVAIVLNTMVGDLYINNMGCAILEILAQFLSGYIIYKKFNLKKTIENIFYIIGIAFIACLLVQDSSDRANYKNMGYFEIIIKLIPVIIGKGTHEMLWTVLYTYISQILPDDLHTFSTANSQIITILICALMPYYKYAMEYINFNSFFGLGVFCIFVGWYTKRYQEDKTLTNKVKDNRTYNRIASMTNFKRKKQFSIDYLSLQEFQKV